MEYKKYILGMIESIDDTDVLMRIYTFIKTWIE